jgi:hypothetical protein
MAATNIGSSKYPLAKVPEMADAADIQVALKYYHWGQETEPESAPTAGVTKYISDLETSVSSINTTIANIVNKTIIDAKGDLIVGSADNLVDNLTVGSEGHVLTADPNATLGIKWAALPLNDTLTSTSTSQGATASTVKTLQDTKAPLNFSTNAQTGTTYSLVKADNGYIIEMSNTSANTLTIPLNAATNGDFAIGSQVTVIQTNSGQTTINVTAGVTLNCTPQGTANTAKLRAQWSSCTLIKRAENTWIAVGDLVA